MYIPTHVSCACEQLYIKCGQGTDNSDNLIFIQKINISATYATVKHKQLPRTCIFPEEN